MVNDCDKLCFSLMLILMCSMIIFSFIFIYFGSQWKFIRYTIFTGNLRDSFFNGENVRFLYAYESIMLVNKSISAFANQ